MEFSTARLVPSPRPSASHASFDVLELTSATAGAPALRIGLVPGQVFYQLRGGASAFDDAVAGAKELAARPGGGGAFAVLAAHPGMLFVVPAFVRGGAPGAVTNARLGVDLAALAGFTPSARHGRVLAIVGAQQVLDLRQLPPTLGSGRG